ncbi:MAG: O-antigen ligase family protein [Candidatus Competibacteraceae bacterium]|nr:O-antigen ligase family protein [Candidatus Competibacteraceae bacterium]
MTESYKLRWFYIFSAIFIALNTLLLYHEMYWLYLTPVLIAIVGLAFLSIDKLFLICAFVTPLSIDLKEADMGAALSIPAEPLMIGAAIMFLFKILAEESLQRKAILHPVSITILLYLLWTAITASTSEIPTISFKYLATRLWFIIPFYLMAVHIFKKPEQITRFIWAYCIPLAGVITYTIIRHANWGFEQKPGHWVMTPFYYDHTQYAAALAIFFPYIIGYTILNRLGLFFKIIVAAIAGLYAVGLLLSYSRASWLSIAGAATIFFAIFFRIRWWMILMGITGMLILFFSFQTEIMMRMEKNKQDSSGQLNEHIQSMSNISTDASNLERILRWNCAWRMFNERPITGWGPGTYAFVYAPFQRSYEQTIISTNFGDVGNAHSEYLGPLSEQGLPGLLIFIAIIMFTTITGVNVFYRTSIPKHIRYLILFLLLGLFTYWIHGFLNNFLETDKLAVPHWGFIAAIVAMDILYPRKIKQNESL